MTEAWQMVRLGDVLKLQNNAVRSADLGEVVLAGVYSFGRGLFKRGPINPAESTYKSFNRLVADDFVISQPKAWEGAVARVSAEFDGCYLSPVFPTFRADRTRLEPAYLEWFCKRKAVWAELQRGSRGMGARRETVSSEQFLSLQLPLPPLADQQRIVARIEGVAGKVGEVSLLRKHAAEQVDALQSAAMNRLFGDYYAGTAGALAVAGWTRLGDVVTDVADGPHVTPDYVEQGVPFITAQNITSGRVQFRSHRFITEEAHRLYQRRAKAERGDVLVTKDGTIGVPCFVDTDKEFSFFVSVALIKPKREVLDGEFLTWVIRAPYLQARIRARSRGDMIRHLVLRETRELMIPVPTLEMQRRFVVYLDGLAARRSGLMALQAGAELELDALLPAVLDRAFKGEL